MSKKFQELINDVSQILDIAWDDPFSFIPDDTDIGIKEKEEKG